MPFKKDLTASPKQKLKSSIQRSLRTSLLQTYPLLNPFIEEIMPKKSSLEQMKLPDRVSLYVCDGNPLFFQHDSDVLLPHLKLVHRFPQCFPTVRIDRGAIRFVLSGATLMAPGLTSAGGRLPEPDAREGRETLGEGAPNEGLMGRGGGVGSWRRGSRLWLWLRERRRRRRWGCWLWGRGRSRRRGRGR
ncbi:translation machinery-associated protein 20 [Podospora pseudoanserina]|uniref:Translation machinery-associated protein 20 n=1 Tax=Podospora pseudoanserina TaxID=2609844 RepID=A0ABR0IDK8_9PEZI|nr:translation machinery-associated protein 20 [Podospora pseudoanserina]